MNECQANTNTIHAFGLEPQVLVGAEHQVELRGHDLGPGNHQLELGCCSRGGPVAEPFLRATNRCKSTRNFVEMPE